MEFSDAWVSWTIGDTVMWIRSPSWDGFWILSGLPLGTALTGLGYVVSYRTIALVGVIVLATGHFMSPIVLAWCHGGYREIMMRRRIKFVWMPVAVASAGGSAAYIGGLFLPPVYVNPDTLGLVIQGLQSFENPLALMAVAYAFWNAYHFGMQAFGVMSIYRRKRGGYPESQRRIDMFYCCSVIWLGILIPLIFRFFLHSQPFFDYFRYGCTALAFAAAGAMLCREHCLPRVLFILTDALGIGLIFFGGLWGFAIISMNHWLVAIGLASHVYGVHRRVSPLPFALALAVMGGIVYCLLFVDLRTGLLHFTALAVGLRISLGFVHFLYDRWIWRLRDPRMRAIIGEDILLPRHSPFRL
jgi:hypothetical protein